MPHDRESLADLADDARLTSAILESALDCVVVMGADGRVLQFNRSAVETFGYPREAAVGTDLADLLIPPALRERHRAGLARFLATGEGTILNRRIELRAVHADGHEMPVELTVTAVDSTQPLFVGYLRDLTEARQVRRRVDAQHAVAQALAASRSAAEAMDRVLVALGESLEFEIGAMWLADERAQALRCAAFWQRPSISVTEFREATMGLSIARGRGPLGRSWDTRRPSRTSSAPTEPDYPRADAAARAGLQGALWVPVLSGGEVLGILEFYSRAESSVDDTLLTTMSAVGSQVGEFLRRRRAEDELSFRAAHDPLTGLPNRTVFLDSLRKALARCERTRRAVAVLFVDLDDFKGVNDTLGHQAGDELLAAAAERLRGVVRRADALARFGGDEFALYAEDLADETDAAAVAERLAASFARPFVLHGAAQLVSASIGIAVTGRADADPVELVRDADVAMYRAKDRGRARYELFDEALRARALKRVRVEHALRSALDRGQLRLAFQPIVQPADGWVAGVEALLRWQHPELGAVPPAEFIPAAERTGHIVAIGQWVLQEACRQAARWRSPPGDQRPVRVAVNVSAYQLVGGEFVEVLTNAAAQAGLAPSRIAVEITESVLLDAGAAATLETLHALRDLGVAIVLDDFGTGYSSLTYIDRFPLDGIKLDRTFIAGLSGKHTSRAILAAVVAMADSLALPVVAEGIETADQAADVRQLGCRFAQGYYFGRPVSDAHIAERILGVGASD